MMNQSIDLRPQDFFLVCQILKQYLSPNTHVWVFGSRAKGASRKYSDLDLLIDMQTPIPLRTLTQLRDAFEESDLAFRVDLVDWNSISDDFRALIKHEKIVLDWMT